MKTDVVAISDNGSNLEALLSQVDALATCKAQSPQNAIHLRLLAEETMALVWAITGPVNGEFCI